MGIMKQEVKMALFRIAVILFIPFLLIGALLFWNNYAPKEAERYDRTLPRNPDTGILSGAEARTCGPEDTRKAILFVHGFIATPGSFSDLPEYVAERGWHVRAMLLPGHGTSPFDFQKTSPAALEEAVLKELDALQQRYDTVVILGHSMGAALATIAAAQKQPDGLILTAPYYAVTKQWYYILRPETWAGLVSPILHWVYRPQNMQPVNRAEARGEILSYNWIPSKGALTAMAVAGKARDDTILQKIAMPTLLIHSKNDTVADPAYAEAVYNRIPSKDKTLHWLLLSDHILFYDYDRETVKIQIAAFLKKWD